MEAACVTCWRLLATFGALVPARRRAGERRPVAVRRHAVPMVSGNQRPDTVSERRGRTDDQRQRQGRAEQARHGVHGNDRVAPRALGRPGDWVYSDLSGDALEDARPDRRRRDTAGRRIRGPRAARQDQRPDARRHLCAVESPTNVAALVGGPRMLKTDQTLNWSLAGTGPVGRTRGVRRQWTPARPTGTPSWACAGARGSGASRAGSCPITSTSARAPRAMTWQAVVGVGYAFDFGDVGLVVALPRLHVQAVGSLADASRSTGLHSAPPSASSAARHNFGKGVEMN